MNIRSSECLVALLLEDKAINFPALEELAGMIANTPERVGAMQAHLQRIYDLDFAINRAPKWREWCERAVDEEVRVTREVKAAAPK